MGFDPVRAAAKRCVVLLGNDHAVRLRAVKQIFQAAGVDENDMEVQTFVGDGNTVQDWVAAASTVPFLAERRIVVVRNLGRFDAPDASQAEVFKQIPESGLVILIGDEESGDYRKLETVGRRLGAWGKALAKAGAEVVSFETPVNAKAETGLREAATTAGKKLGPQAARELLAAAGGDFVNARDEIEKLAAYVGASDEITVADVQAAATKDLSYNVWQLIDAVADGNQKVGLGQLRTMMAGSKDSQGEVLRLIPLVASQFRKIWQARGLVEAGRMPQSPGEAAVHLPKAKPISKEGDYSQSKAMRQAGRLEFRQLSKCLDLLVEADARLKGQSSGVSPVETAEQLVLGMARICAGR